MKKYNASGIGEDLVMTITFLLFATIATAQPWTAPGYAYQDAPPTLAELKNSPAQKPVKVLGLFKTNRQASTVLTAYGIAATAKGNCKSLHNQAISEKRHGWIIATRKNSHSKKLTR